MVTCPENLDKNEFFNAYVNYKIMLSTWVFQCLLCIIMLATQIFQSILCKSCCLQGFFDPYHVVNVGFSTQIMLLTWIFQSILCCQHSFFNADHVVNMYFSMFIYGRYRSGSCLVKCTLFTYGLTNKCLLNFFQLINNP